MGGAASPRDRAPRHVTAAPPSARGAGRGPGSRAGGRPRAARSWSGWGRAVALCSPGAPGGSGEKSREGPWSFGIPEGGVGGRRASNRSGRRALEGTEGTCVAGGAGPLLGTEGAQPGPHRPRPQEREALCPCWAAAEGGGEEAPGPSPVSSPLEGPEGEELYSDLSARGTRRWWAVVVLAALPSLGAGGEKNLEAPPESWTQLWFFRFLVNAAGYASFMVPGYLLVQYFRRKNYLETGVWGKGGGSVLALD